MFILSRWQSLMQSEDSWAGLQWFVHETGANVGGYLFIWFDVFCFPALRSMWEAPDVSIRPSQTKFDAAG